MAEGGIPNENDLRKNDALVERGRSRVPNGEGDILGMNINSFIATLTDTAASPLSHPDDHDSLIRGNRLYGYLRDTQAAQTVGQAHMSIEERKIDPAVVRTWVDEGMLVDRDLYEATVRGYPEYEEDLKRIRHDTVQHIMKRKLRFS